MHAPPFLQKGDKVAVLSTASKIDQSHPETKEKLEFGIAELESWGLEVVRGDTLDAAHHQYAGTDEERIQDFQRMLDDPSIKAIICARGGYGSVRILDHISFENYIESPKWISGYSDVTAFHNHINQNFGIQSIHSVMVSAMKGKEKATLKSLKKALFGKKLKYKAKGSVLNKSGESSGQVVGGNLSILYSLMGSNSQLDTTGKILFIEDVGEKLYHVDRMMMNLKRAGLLNQLAGLVVGGFTNMKDNEVPYGKTAQEIILEHTEPFNYPIAFDFPAGHQSMNVALYMGRAASLQVSPQKMTLEYK